MNAEQTEVFNKELNVNLTTWFEDTCRLRGLDSKDEKLRGMFFEGANALLPCAHSGLILR